MRGCSETTRACPSGRSCCRQATADCPVEWLAAAFQALLALGIRDRATLGEVLRQTLESQPGILAAWTVWEPNALDQRDELFRYAPGHDATGRFIACWHRALGTPRLEAVTGYERPGLGDWYWVPKNKVLSCQIQPIHYPLGGKWVWMTSQVTPILLEGRFVGVVGIDCPAQSPVPPPCQTKPKSTTVETRPLHEEEYDSLTPREREVLHWLRLGRSNEEIGIILGISHHTVKNHLERVFQKLGVHSRFEAIQYSRPPAASFPGAKKAIASA